MFETKELTFVNDCFKQERNEGIGHYRQTLFSFCFSDVHIHKTHQATNKVYWGLWVTFTNKH